jgi:hypothetical protein
MRDHQVESSPAPDGPPPPNSDGTAVWHQPLPWQTAPAGGDIRSAEAAAGPEARAAERMLGAPAPAHRFGRAASKPFVVGAAVLGSLIVGTSFLLTGQSEDVPRHAVADEGYAPLANEPEPAAFPSSDPTSAAPSPSSTPSHGKPPTHAARSAEKTAAQSGGHPPTGSATHAAAVWHTPRPTAPANAPTRSGTSGGSVGKPRSTPSKSTAPKSWTTVVVNATSVLMPGQSWQSNRTRVVMQTDGNLVIYDENNRARWTSGTTGTGYKAVFQADGNFVVYTRDNATAWSTRTDGHDGAELVLQDDGNVTILDGGVCLWASNTAH